MESSRFRDDDSDLNLSEWNSSACNNKARISRHNTMSRRFFREDSRSFRSNFTVSSTASSPGYAFKDEIDPSTYCFSTALKALQARSVYHTWECSSPEGLALNSKWNEAEKYICNPLSGKVPLECLSAKSLISSGRSFRNSSNRFTMSAPLVFSSSTHLPLSKPPLSSSTTQDFTMQFPILSEMKKEGRTRDVGTQSTPPYLSSSSPSPASTPSIIERSIKRVGESSPVSNSKTTKSEEDEVEEEKVKETEETERVTTTQRDQKEDQLCSSRRKQQAGCFSWTWMTNRFLRNHHKTANKPRKYHNNVFPTHHHFKPC
ncbi:uncharacterized protein LOC114760730 [Neltuma alba]|uniref:uncharacterized protein LOC114760730 n=1 Tax=Neltuma alba TaxID=207710 RepID=UPI0010A4E491|nr:uncharacterized protein LOC114760730 [Prosopis alba]